MCGKLYVVATPIGNLADFSHRAVEILKQVDLIAAEDTRHVMRLLQHYGISNRLISLHQHNEEKASPELLDKIKNGLTVALVSDAGTPLLSDPGMPLVKLARQQNIEVSPVPGACALIAALSVSGLATTQFRFEGFSPRTSSARKNFFLSKKNETVTWAFYESSHRILASLEDLSEIVPGDRQIVIARELTKLHETIVKDSLAKILQQVRNNIYMRKGEFVVLVEGHVIEKKPHSITEEQTRVLTILLKQCSIKTAVALATEITGARKKLIYQAALELNKILLTLKNTL
ncbi:MAG: 16S rRNA (cytidine(1402)-2'-O)-methyltransferase [Methylococcales symbiont of Hymedesmia sp. n. MRB-2018]|nr:MAG: 16S rRNA (cytidine(1402)-2'-O)-methyltransferase [Methylococcales symbiont of Hymedesmia sp. n. MRB-2018]KAF3983112.1 MAG: 16S rRNA (cytidine(1402)-2'-O)-methyltransferase [Methylococcales symbiont of Hymedesmia sp. n. MRB-2018]